MRLLRETLVRIHPLPAWQTAWKFLLKSFGENTTKENIIHVDSIQCYQEFRISPSTNFRQKVKNTGDFLKE